MSATDRVSEDIRRLAYRVERYLRLEAASCKDFEFINTCADKFKDIF